MRATPRKRQQHTKTRSLFTELMSGVAAMRGHREGRITLKTRDMRPISVPPIDPTIVRETRGTEDVEVRVRVQARRERDAVDVWLQLADREVESTLPAFDASLARSSSAEEVLRGLSTRIAQSM